MLSVVRTESFKCFLNVSVILEFASSPIKDLSMALTPKSSNLITGKRGHANCLLRLTWLHSSQSLPSLIQARLIVMPVEEVAAKQGTSTGVLQVTATFIWNIDQSVDQRTFWATCHVEIMVVSALKIDGATRHNGQSCKSFYAHPTAPATETKTAVNVVKVSFNLRLLS